MALINCSECNKEVSDKASTCPNCGNPINVQSFEQVKNQYDTSLLSEENSLECPKCNSTQLTSNKKGFSGKQAVAGAVLTGGIGLLAGTLGSSNVLVTCLKCGYRYNAGDYSKEKQKFVMTERHERLTSQKIANGEQSFEGVVILFFILSIIGVVISYKLWSNDWNFLGFIFGVATLLCLGMLVITISTEASLRNKHKH